MEWLDARIDFLVLKKQRVGRVSVIQEYQHELVPQRGEDLVVFFGRGGCGGGLLGGHALSVLDEYIGESVGT